MLVTHLDIDPDMNRLREHPRFQAMLAGAKARLAGSVAASA